MDPPSSHTDMEEFPGEHLPHEVRERALDGFYVDIFALIKSDEGSGIRGSRVDTQGKKELVREHNFAN